MPEPAFARHDLLRVDHAAWGAVIGGSVVVAGLGEAQRSLVEGWAARGWPVMVRRPDASDGPGFVPVGIPLPPSLGKLRLAFCIPVAAVTERLAAIPLRVASSLEPGPVVSSLSDVMAGPDPAISERSDLGQQVGDARGNPRIEHGDAHDAETGSPAELAATDRLRPQINAALVLGQKLGIEPNVFGALLWQHLTGLAYLHDNSDIDLLWPDNPRLSDLLDGLDSLDRAGPARIDGEIIFPSGEGVNWRELQRERTVPGGMVLAKSMNGARLICAHTPLS